MGAAALNFEAWFMHVLNVFPGETNNGICSHIFSIFGRCFHSCLKRKGGVFSSQNGDPKYEASISWVCPSNGGK